MELLKIWKIHIFLLHKLIVLSNNITKVHIENNFR